MNESCAHVSCQSMLCVPLAQSTRKFPLCSKKIIKGVGMGLVSGYERGASSSTAPCLLRKGSSSPPCGEMCYTNPIIIMMMMSLGGRNISAPLKSHRTTSRCEQSHSRVIWLPVRVWSRTPLLCAQDWFHSRHEKVRGQVVANTCSEHT